MTTATEIDETEIITDDVDDIADENELDEDVGFSGAVEDPAKRARRRIRAVGYGALLALPFVLAAAIGCLKYVSWTQSETATASAESVHAASEAAVAMLSYRPDTVQNDLEAAKGRMTGPFRDSYGSLVDDVVAPAAIQKLISATATVPAAASVSATRDHAVVLIFVNQSTTVGKDAPENMTSCVRVTLDKIDNRWLVSGFDPV